MDRGAIKGGAIIHCCVGVVVIRIVDEMGTVVMGRITGGEVVIGGITGGVDDEAVEEEGQDLGDL